MGIKIRRAKEFVVKVNAGIRWHKHASTKEMKTASSSADQSVNGIEPNKWKIALRNAVEHGTPVPKELIYHDRVHLWKTASRQEHYYQTHDEERMMRDNCQEIAARIAPGAVMVDFGSG